MIDPLSYTDVEALDELQASAGWALLKTRLELQLTREFDTLERDVQELVHAKARGSVATLRMVLGLPRSMREEFAPTVKL